MADSIYHVGDEVVVSPKLVEGGDHHVFEGSDVTLYVNGSMAALRGRKAEIVRVFETSNHHIYYEINISSFSWTADMFEENDAICDIKLDFDLLGGCCS